LYAEKARLRALDTTVLLIVHFTAHRGRPQLSPDWQTVNTLEASKMYHHYCHLKSASARKGQGCDWLETSKWVADWALPHRAEGKCFSRCAPSQRLPSLRLSEANPRQRDVRCFRRSRWCTCRDRSDARSMTAQWRRNSTSPPPLIAHSSPALSSRSSGRRQQPNNSRSFQRCPAARSAQFSLARRNVWQSLTN
jgi:hypothetical protein